MEIFWWLFGIAWITGWVRELSHIHSVCDSHQINYPSKAVKNIVPVILLFAWPYFYFYGKTK